MGGESLASARIKEEWEGEVWLPLESKVGRKEKPSFSHLFSIISYLQIEAKASLNRGK